MNGLGTIAGLAGLGNLAGQVPVSITIDSTRQRVGQPPIYRITGAPPGQGVLWTSYRNGIPTGEKDDYYGHTIEANGTLEIKGDPWTSDQDGRWQKQIEITDSDGKRYLGQVEFIVEPDLAAQPNAPIYAPPSSGGSFLSQELFALGEFSVTPGTLLGVAVGAYVLKALKIIK